MVPLYARGRTTRHTLHRPIPLHLGLSGGLYRHPKNLHQGQNFRLPVDRSGVQTVRRKSELRKGGDTRISVSPPSQKAVSHHSRARFSRPISSTCYATWPKSQIHTVRPFFSTLVMFYGYPGLSGLSHCLLLLRQRAGVRPTAPVFHSYHTSRRDDHQSLISPAVMLVIWIKSVDFFRPL